jgi:hypothetical protein
MREVPSSNVNVDRSCLDHLSYASEKDAGARYSLRSDRVCNARLVP